MGLKDARTTSSAGAGTTISALQAGQGSLRPIPRNELLIARHSHCSFSDPRSRDNAASIASILGRLTIWPKPMQNLRATRETELIALYPIKDVASWLGNSAPIAMKHYGMTMQSSFERAITNGTAGVDLNPPHSVTVDGNQTASWGPVTFVDCP